MLWFVGVRDDSRDACMSLGVGSESDLAVEPVFGAVLDVDLDTVMMCL